MSEANKIKHKNTPLYRFARCVGKFMTRCIFPTRYEGLENIPKEGGFMLCCNHRSMLDPFFACCPIKQQMRFMAKDSLFRNKILAFLITRLGAFPIKRGSADTKAIETAIEIMENGGVLLIFPEGTRSKDGQLLPHKAGAAMIASRTNSDVLPCAISWEGKLCLFRKTVVRFGPIIRKEEIRVEGMSKTQLKQAMHRIQDEMTALFGYPEAQGPKQAEE